jgi:adenine-specific DNA-methyltransferase
MLQPIEQSEPKSIYPPPPTKAALGQYMTPPNIASFMASLFSRKQGSMYLLDPGTGQGALSHAFLSRWKEGSLSFQDGYLDAFEIDPRMLYLSRKNLERHSATLPLSLNMWQGDFIEHAVQKILRHERPYSHAILNPPYKKINSNSHHRMLLRDVGIETVNLYSAFVALSVAMLSEGGQIVAVIPRSFCNGPYYKPFREFILNHTSIIHIHLFEARNKAFKTDNVLQENVILMLERDAPQGDIVISTSTDDSMHDYAAISNSFTNIVYPRDPEVFLHIPTNGDAPKTYPTTLCHTLKNIGIEVSTGPVVDFRMKEYLHRMPEGNDVPLLYSAHFKGNGEWPIVNFKKNNAIKYCPETMKWLYPNGYYVIVRRMSSKEEKRRIVANIVDPSRFSGVDWIGFENHLNVFHFHKQGISENIAYGLSVFLNSSFIDSIFRRFNGNTQVNATDLRALRYPSRKMLEYFGMWAKDQTVITQEDIDRLMENFLE